MFFVESPRPSGKRNSIFFCIQTSGRKSEQIDPSLSPPDMQSVPPPKKKSARTVDFPFLFRFSAFWRTKLQDVFNNSLYKHIQSTSRNRPGNFKEISALMFASKFNYLLMILRMRLMHLNRYTCYIFVHYINIWSNYSDLTRPHPKWWFSKGDPLISGKSRLVKYNNLARNIYRYLISRDMHYIKYIQLDLYFLIQNTSIFANMYTNTR